MVATRQRASSTEVDAVGDTFDDWTVTLDLELPDAHVAPVTEGELTAGYRGGGVTEWALYVPHQWADVAAGDRIVYDGGTYEVEGTPAKWVSPLGSHLGGIIAQLRAVDG